MSKYPGSRELKRGAGSNWLDLQIRQGPVGYTHYGGTANGMDYTAAIIPGPLQTREIAEHVAASAPDEVRVRVIGSRLKRLALLRDYVRPPAPVKFYVHENVVKPGLLGVNDQALADGLRHMSMVARASDGKVELRCVRESALSDIGRVAAGRSGFILMDMADLSTQELSTADETPLITMAAINDLRDVALSDSPRLAQVLELEQALNTSPEVMSIEESLDFIARHADDLDA